MSSLKVILISAGVVSVAIGIKLSAPVLVDGVPAMWSAIMVWMKPLYLYIIVNGIILTLAAASCFQQSQSSETPAVQFEGLYSVKTPPPMIFAAAEDSEPEIKAIFDEPKLIVASSPKFDAESTKEILVDAEAEYISINTLPEESVYTELRSDSLLPVREKPVVSSRFGHQRQIRSNPDAESAKEALVDTEAEDTSINTPRKENQFNSPLPVREKPLVSSRFGNRRQIRNNPEGARALRVARPKRQETLETTWKMITEGRHVPLTRHDRGSGGDNSPSARIRKEASVGQDDLNRRVEAFIKKFNEDLRIQRQESLQQFTDMINRGV